MRPCGRTVDGRYLVHGVEVTSDQFFTWRQQVLDDLAREREART